MNENKAFKARTINRLLPAEKIDMDGFPVLQPFPTVQVDQIDPFLLLHHAEITFPEHLKPIKSGIGPHPHRGFIPVTFVYKGGVHHRDSRGNSSVIYEGGTQWMKAARGIIHSERPPENIAELGNVQEIVQIWINLPQKNKMDQPEYFPLTSEQTPSFTADSGKVKVQVVAGEQENIKGPIPTNAPVLALRFYSAPGGTYNFSIPEDHNAFVYLLDGAIRVPGYGLVEGKNAILLNNDGTGFTFEATQQTRAILMSGKPINEPLAKQGPFVMNTETEILHAMRDYRQGKMGILIEE